MNNHKSLKIIIIILCLLVVTLFVACYFLYQDVKRKNENYHVFFRDLTFQNNEQNYLTSKLKIMNDNSIDLGRVDGSIVPKDGEVGFIEELEATAKVSGLSIEISSLGLDNNSRIASSSANILNIKARTIGSWSANYTFLARLESLPFKVKINRYGITNTSVGENPETIKTNAQNNVWQGLFEIAVLKYK